jgi:hypothetical protein
MMHKTLSGLFSYVPAVVVALLFISCRKENRPGPISAIPHPQMEYFDLKDTAIKANQPGFAIDVNHDGRKDLAFSTLLVGDPLNQVDKLQFLASGNIKINFPVNAGEQVPVMNNGDSIQLEDFNGYHWYELSSIVLVQKIISSTAPVTWEGHWKNALHKYLPYQVVVNNDLYNGWVELSADLPNERIVLHRAALSKEANKVISAGR